MGDNQENLSNRSLTPYFVVSHIDILGMSRLLNTLDEFCDLSDFQYVSKELRKKDPLMRLESCELNQIKGELGTFNREVAFDMDDDIIIAPNFLTRKSNQLLVIPPAALMGMCKQCLKVH